MPLRVHIYPEPDEKVDSVGTGIKRIINAQCRWLPKYGIDLVASPKEAEVYAVHVNPPDGTDVDVLHNHGLYPTAELEMPLWTYEVNRRVIDAALRAKVVTTPSPWVAEIFARDMGFSPVVVPHGIEQEEWPEPPEDRSAVVLWNKNRPSDVCSVVPTDRLALMRPNTQFVVTFGHARPNVQVVGATSFGDMQALLYQCGVYFAPTKETFGIGILEAMAAGLPVLTWNWGHNRYLLEHCVHGYIAEPGDYEDTARGLDYCLRHRVRLSKAARAHAMSPEFSWTQAMELYAKVYRLAALSPTRPLVSVIIPCYNYGQYVARAIQSVRAQTHRAFECLVVDDGSTDDSRQVIAQAIKGDSRFKLIEQENAKVAAARNHGALESKGQFLLFLDADDEIKPRCLELLLPPLLQDPTLGVSYGGLEALSGSDPPRLSDWPGEPNFAQQLHRVNQVPTCCLLRRRAFFRAGGFRQHAIPAEDAELWTRVGLIGYKFIKATREATFTYRYHEGSATAGTVIRGGRAQEPDWLGWLPAANGGPQPFASIAPTEKRSHPVRNYDQPWVSFVTPVGEGHQELLLDAIESVAAQVDPRWELLVVDDTEVGDLSSYGLIPYHLRYPFIRWLRNPKHRNVSAARNFGAQAARGHFLCFLDADDVLQKRFVAEVLPKAVQHPGGIVYTDWMELPKVEQHHAEAWDLERLLDHALFAITFLHPKRAFLEIGGFDESLDIWEDWDYTVRLALQGYWGLHVPQVLFGYRYDTGKRREECLEDAQARIPEMQARYKGARPLPPRGSRQAFKTVVQGDLSRGLQVPLPRLRRGPVAPTQEAQRAALRERFAARGDGLVLVEYIGRGGGAVLYRAPSGARYRFGSGRHSVKPVREEDVEFFTSRTQLFRLVEA